MLYGLSTLREKGRGRKREGRKEKGRLYGDVCRTPELLKISMLGRRRAVTVSLIFGNSNYGNTPDAAVFTKLRA